MQRFGFEKGPIHSRLYTAVLGEERAFQEAIPKHEPALSKDEHLPSRNKECRDGYRIAVVG
jgi:hypothetical protein